MNKNIYFNIRILCYIFFVLYFYYGVYIFKLHHLIGLDSFSTVTL
jgi:hypothetical protein